MAFKLKDGSGVEHTYDQKKLKIPSTTEGETVVFTEGEVQEEKVVTIAENGTMEVTPDAGYDSVKKVGVTVDVPAPVTSVNGATGDVKTVFIVQGTYTSSGTATLDKTEEEIQTAAAAGYSVVCYLMDDTLSAESYLPLTNRSPVVFSGVVSEVTLGIPSDGTVVKLYYDSKAAGWKHSSGSIVSPFVVTLSTRNNKTVANKTWDEIYQAAVSKVLSSDYLIGCIDFTTNLMLQAVSASDTSIAFQGTTIKDGEPILLTQTVDSNNTWTTTITPLSGNFLVKLTGDSSSYTADKTFEQISGAYLTGKNVNMEVEGMIGHLMQIDDDVASFMFNIINIIIMVNVNSDNTVEIEQIHPFPLTVNLEKSGDTYSGDATFAEIQAVLEYGQTVQVQYSTSVLHLSGYSDEMVAFTGLQVLGNGVGAINVTVSSDDTWTYDTVTIKELTSGS